MSVPWYLMAKGKGGGGYKTASGPIVSVNDALAAPLRSLVANIEPVQEGSGDPSPDNVRPISWWSAVKVWRTGKNLCGGKLFAEGFRGANGFSIDTTNKTFTFSRSNAKLFKTMKYKENTQYSFVFSYTGGRNNCFNLYYTDGTDDYGRELPQSDTKNIVVITSSAGKTIDHASLDWRVTNAVTAYYDECGIFEGAITASEFEQYDGNTYGIEFPTSKNLFNGYFLQGYWAYANGEWASDSHWITTGKIHCKPSTYYTASASEKMTRWQGFVWYDIDGNYISSSNEQTNANIGLTKQSPSNAAYMVFNIAAYPSSSSTISPSDVTNFQIEEGQTATTYEAPNIVYGGTLDVTNGVLTVDRVADTFTKDSNWYGFATGSGNSSAVVQFSMYQNCKYVDGSASYNGSISSTGVEAQNYWVGSRQNEDPPQGDMCFAYSSTGQLRFHRLDVASITDLESFKSAFPDTTICYYLATPITIPLTPTEISTLQGQNNVWADSGDVDVEYLASGGANADLMKLAVAFMGRK